MLTIQRYLPNAHIGPWWPWQLFIKTSTYLSTSSWYEVRQGTSKKWKKKNDFGEQTNAYHKKKKIKIANKNNECTEHPERHYYPIKVMSWVWKYTLRASVQDIRRKPVPSRSTLQEITKMIHMYTYMYT